MAVDDRRRALTGDSGHPRATAAYAWSFENDAGNLRHVAVLGVPPVNSARDAVRAAIAAQSGGAHQ